MEYDFDAIVVGSGAGGAAFARSCAAAGKRVLVIERGRPPRPNGATAHDERWTLIDKKPYDDRFVDVNDSPSRLYMGGVPGGSTALFGGVMLRPSKQDFQPGRHYGDRLPRHLWEWPISYDELRPYYDQAESLFRLSGSHDDEYQPLEAPGAEMNDDVLPMAPINHRLTSTNRAHGLRPFRLPLAIDSRRCRRCPSCAGFLCPHDARRSAAHLLEEAAVKDTLCLMTGTEIERLELAADGRIMGVVVRNRETQSQQVLRAKCYALAAGAIGSPVILLRSGIEGPNVGRNYMMHYSPLAVGLFAASTGANETFVKQVGFADFYFGTPEVPQKMGLVQSLPAPGTLMLAKSGLKRWPQGLLKFMRRRMLPMCGIVEDLPDPENRVYLKHDGAIALKHQFSEFDRQRGKSLGQAMRRILKRAGALLCVSRAFPSHDHVAHQCGTLRFGHDPAHAVVDPDCRTFDRPNLFVVDGSVLPTSMGVGPSLTIVANGLRVAKAALAQM